MGKHDLGISVPGENRPQTVGESIEEQAALYRILIDQSKRYTMGESTSVPVETAQELLLSIRFCIACHRDGAKGGSAMSLQEQWQSGMQEIWALMEQSRELFSFVQAAGTSFGNLAYETTLVEISNFFRFHDYRYFAHQIPCMIDYPLCRPVPDELLGIHYIRQYLMQMLMENRLIGQFAPGRVELLLKRTYADYRGLLVNLFQPVLLNAVALTLLGKEPSTLSVDAPDPPKLRQLFLQWQHTVGALTVQTARGIQALCDRFGIVDNHTIQYYTGCAQGALPWIMAAKEDAWRRIFPSLE